MESPQIAAPLELWIVEGDRPLTGPAPALCAAITALAGRVNRTGKLETQDVALGADAPAPRAVRLAARPLGGGRVAVASLGLDGLGDAERALSRYEMVVHVTRDAVWDWDVVGQRTWWNPQQYDMLGYDPRSTVPSYEAWASRMHPDDRDRVEQHIRASVAAGETMWQGEYRFVRTDGSVRVALDRGYIERDANGEPRRMVGVMTDITAEREAVAGLKASEERFREMTSAIDQVFWLCNRDMTEVLYVSPAYETVWGRTSASLYRKPLSFLDAIHEDDRARIEAGLAGQREDGYDETFRIRRPDGTVAWIRDRAYPIRNAAGEVVRIAGVATDVTAQLQLEQQLAQAQRMDSIGRLAGGIAHDFNNLLTVILPTVQLAMAALPRGAKLRGELEAIEDAATRAARLTSQMLAFARRQVVAPARMDLNELARDTEQLLRRVLGEHIELRTVLGHELGAVIADRGQLEQVLVNLAINARDAMPNGGCLTIETGNLTVGVGQIGSDPGAADFLEPGSYVVLAVSDTGIGIPPDTLPHVFEPFFTTKPPGQGTGLGLATCYGIVRQAGGVILVETAPGGGSTFKVILPRAGAQAEAKLRRPSVAPGRGTETILYVEDEQAVRKVGVRILSEQDYRVLEAADAEQALDLAASHPGPIHLLITDVVMPHMSGIDLARKLARQRPDLRVVYTSGYSDHQGIREGMLEPGATFLQKPFTVEALVGKVRELLDAPA